MGWGIFNPPLPSKKQTNKNAEDIETGLVYPNSLLPIKMCSDCETCGLLNDCK